MTKSHIVIFKEGKYYKGYMIFLEENYRSAEAMKKGGVLLQARTEERIVKLCRNFCKLNDITNGFRFIPS